MQQWFLYDTVGLIQSLLEQIHFRIKCSQPRWIETGMCCPKEISDSANIKTYKMNICSIARFFQATEAWISRSEIHDQKKTKRSRQEIYYPDEGLL